MRLTKAREALYRELIDRARIASELAYAPYSGFKVGAAVLTFDDRIYIGCNIENAAFSGTVHAESCAGSNAIASGALERARQAGLTQFDFIQAIAIHLPEGADPWPCGHCRQFLSEFGLDMDVVGIVKGTKRELDCRRLRSFFPRAFDLKQLAAEKESRHQKQKR